MHKGNPGSLGNLGHRLCKQKNRYMGNFPGGLLVKATHFCCGGTASIPGWGTKILHSVLSQTKNPKWVPYTVITAGVEEYDTL